MTSAQNATRERILASAAQLFSKRGYAAVTLRDIASSIGIKHASLYYYAPGGKKELYVAVMERNFLRHRQGLTDAIVRAGVDVRMQLYAVADWFVTQPPLNLSRLHEADMDDLGSDQADALMTLAYDAMRTPLRSIFEPAAAAGLVQIHDFNVAALALVSLLQSVHNVPAHYPMPVRYQIGHTLVDMLLDGWRTR